MTSDRDRLIASFATAAQVDATQATAPGTSVIPRPERAGTGQVACYRVLASAGVAGHTYLWVDPEVIARFEPLADLGRSLSMPEFGAEMAKVQADELGHGVMRVREPAIAANAPTLDACYRVHALDATDATDLALITAFAETCDPDDVEEAALDEVDENETDIRVIVHDPDRLGGSPAVDTIAAYGSAAPWDWDPVMGDIGVLTVPGHRGRGLGRDVVSVTIESMLTAGRVPLYRHSVTNAGSAAVATALGFEVVLDLAIWSLPESSDEHTG